jgi:hypothetical protein
MAGLGKKPAVMASADFARLFDQVSKAALIDALWCACQLGTDESAEQITTKAAREVGLALKNRGDKIARDIKWHANKPIDSDAAGDSEVL